MDSKALLWLKERQAEASIRAKRAFLIRGAEIQNPETVADIVFSQYGENRKSELINNAKAPHYWLERLEQDLFDDVRHLADENELVNKCALAFIPDIRGNAIAARVDTNSYAMALNLGLVWLCLLLTQAILMESENDRTDNDGKNVFLSAIKAFLATSYADFSREISYCNSLAKQEIQISSGGTGSIVLRFIALHELAHVKLGHADVFGRSLLSTQDGINTVYHVLSSAELSDRQRDELLADRYAMRQIIVNAASKETAWNAILFVYAFFNTLQHIEDDLGTTVCPEHPAPVLRGKELLRFATSEIGSPDNDALVWINMVFNTWRENYMNEIPFSVRTESGEEVLSAFKGESALIADGLKIIHHETIKERGMVLEEVVINFGLSLVSGVPAGIVANYLYQKFGKNGENIIRIDGKLVKDIEEIKVALEQLTNKHDD